MFGKRSPKGKEKLCTFLEAVEDEKYQDDEEEMQEAAFTRQHYQAIADILSPHMESGGEEIAAIAGDIADLFENDNPRFDRGKFMDAAGVKNEEKEDDEEEMETESCGKDHEVEEEKEEDEEDMEEAATGLDSKSNKKIERLAALISSERSSTGSSKTDEEALKLAAKELLFGDPAKLNLKVAGDEDPDPEERKDKEEIDEAAIMKKPIKHSKREREEYKMFSKYKKSLQKMNDRDFKELLRDMEPLEREEAKALRADNL